MASALAATAYWENSSIRFASFASMVARGSKSFTCAASFTLYAELSNRSSRPIPTLFSFKLFQNVSTEFPMGVIAPHAGYNYSFHPIPIPPSTCITCPVI